MPIVISSSLAKLLWPGLNAFFGMEYNEHPLEFKSLFKQKSSSKAYEEDVALSGFGLAPQKNEGASITYDSFQQLYVTRYTHVVYANGFIITREIMEDNQYPDVGPKKSQALSYSIRQTQENVAANIFNRAFNSSYVGGDGVELCNSAHLAQGATFSNILSPAADISSASLEQMAINIMLLTDNRGLKINIKPDKVLIPPNVYFDANRILKSALEYDTANNAINALKFTNMFPGGIVMNHYLTDTDAFFILTDCPNGLKYFERRAPEFAPAENDFDTENAKFKATWRGSFGWGDPRTAYGSQGA